MSWASLPDAPRHVFMTADAVGGVWTYAAELAAGLSRRGVRVTLAVLGPGCAPGRRRALESLDHIVVVETGLPLDWMEGGPDTLKRTSRQLAACAADTGADLIHLNTPIHAGEAGFLAPVVGVCHACPDTWWAAAGQGEAPSDSGWRRDALRRGYVACDRLVAPSYAFMQATAAAHGIVPDTVWNGLGRAKRAGDGDKDRLALTSGRLWDEGKNIRVLDRAAARMKGVVLAAGPTEGPDGATTTFEALLGLGALEPAALDARLNASAVFVSAALYDPFGLGVLEAAQAGCALVLSDIPTYRELWQGAAIFIDPADEVALAERLDALLDDPAETHRLGRLAMARSAEFTTGAMVDGVLKIYADALSARAPFEGAAA